MKPYLSSAISIQNNPELLLLLIRKLYPSPAGQLELII